MSQITKPLVLDETAQTIATNLATIATKIDDGLNTVHYTSESKTDAEKTIARTNIDAASNYDITTLRTDLNTVNYLTTVGTNVTCSPNVNYYNNVNLSADFTLTFEDSTESSTKANEWHYVFYNTATTNIKVTLNKTNATFYTPNGSNVSGTAYLRADSESYCEISVLRIGYTNNYLANICCYPSTTLV